LAQNEVERLKKEEPEGSGDVAALEEKLKLYRDKVASMKYEKKEEVRRMRAAMEETEVKLSYIFNNKYHITIYIICMLTKELYFCTHIKIWLWLLLTTGDSHPQPQP